MNILYISYAVVRVQIRESQVVAYLERLSARYAITLLSFEKRRDLTDHPRVEALRDRLVGAGIRWCPLRYHKSPPVLSTAWDIANGMTAAIRLARRERVQVVHARSYVPALIA